MSTDRSKQPSGHPKQPEASEPPSSWRVIISVFATLFVLVLIFLVPFFRLPPPGRRWDSGLAGCLP